MKNGFLLINKDKGPSSFDIIKNLRKKLGIKKIGHTGTLDPLASGLMFIGIGKGTKFLEFHKKDKKTYKAKIIFGKISETFDGEGPVMDTNFKGFIEKEEVKKYINTFFLGKIKQIPPKYSAIKVGGKKLCNLVRKGIEVKVPEREVEIFKNEIIDFKYPEITLEIECSSGTYIRSIANDLGKKLGCGGYLSFLERSKIEEFLLKNSNKIENVSEIDILDLDFGLILEKLIISEIFYKRLKLGQRIFFENFNKEGLFKLYLEDGKFIGTGNVIKKVLHGKIIV